MRWRFWLLIFGITLIVLGGVQEIALWRVCRRTPSPRTYEELAEFGPGPNAHLVLSGFELLISAFVYEEQSGYWTVAWVPAVPSGIGIDRTDPVLQQRVRLLVKLPRARSMADVVAASQEATLQGMVTNAIEDLGPEQRARLERHYPGVDFARCWIFEVGRKPASLLLIASSLAIGSGAILFVLWSLLAGHSPKPPQPPPSPGHAIRPMAQDETAMPPKS